MPGRIRKSARIGVGLAAALLAASVSSDEIRVAVAANFATTMSELSSRFEALTDHEVIVSAGSTGRHYAQIRNGAPFDVFLAADARRPSLLEAQGRAMPGSRFTYALGRLALWSRDAGLVDAEGEVLDAGRFRHLAIANPDLAPYGAAARQALERRGLWDALHGRLVRGEDVGQVFGFVHARAAELGFVSYSQLLRTGRLIEGSYWLVPESLHDPIEQQAVLLRERPAARALLEFIRSDEAREIIRGHGYSLVPPSTASPMPDGSEG